MRLFLPALGLLLFFEGMPYFINPGGMKRAALFLAALDERTLRTGGLLLMCAGFGLLYAFVY